MFDVKSIAIAAAVGLLIGSGGSWVGQDWRYGNKIAKIKAEAAVDEAERSANLVKAYSKAQIDRDVLQQRVTQLDTDYTGKLKGLQDENSKLSDCLRSGKCHGGVRVAAVCPKPGVPAASGPTGAASVDDAASARLTPNAQQDYLDLRDAIAKQRLMLEGLQSYIRELQQK